MNKQRRRALGALIPQLEMMCTLREEITDRLDTIMGEEQEALDNLPESLQESERGQQMQEYIDTMEEVLDALQEIDFDDLISSIEEIADS